MQPANKGRGIWQGYEVFHCQHILRLYIRIALYNLIHHTHAVKKHICRKDMVIHSLQLHGHTMFLYPEDIGDTGNHIDRDIAQADHFFEIRITQNSFRNHTCRICKVNHPCIRTKLLHILYNIQYDRNRTECFKHSPGTVGFLSNHPVG